MIYDRENIQVRTLHRAVDFTDKNVLEIGCGDGKISVFLAEGAKEYTAIDPDEDKISRAAAASAGTGRLTFQTGTGQDLAFESGTLDLVLFTLSLHHQESARALDEAFRVLRPGGHALVLEPCADGEFQQCFHLFEDETRALEQAREAVSQSRFTCTASGRFSVPAEFEGLEDIYDYFFNRDGEALNTPENLDCPENRDKILNLLGEFGKTPAAGPFSVYETLVLYTLEKT